MARDQIMTSAWPWSCTHELQSQSCSKWCEFVCLQFASHVSGGKCIFCIPVAWFAVKRASEIPTFKFQTWFYFNGSNATRNKKDSDCRALTIDDDTRLARWLSTTRDAATRDRWPSCFEHRDMLWSVFCGPFLTHRRVSGSEMSHADSATYNCRTCSLSVTIGVDRGQTTGFIEI